MPAQLDVNRWAPQLAAQQAHYAARSAFPAYNAQCLDIDPTTLWMIRMCCSSAALMFRPWL